MKQQTTQKTLLLVLAIAFTVTLNAQFADGQGTEEDPWQIATAEHLNNVRNYLGEQHNDKFFIQTADIDLGVPPWNEDEGWAPIGEPGNGFSGSFDGSRYVITGLTINRPGNEHQGLFGHTERAELQNIGLLDVYMLSASVSGALVGINNGTVRECYSLGSVQTNDAYVSGLTGHNQGAVVNSYSLATVSGACCFAGIAGINEGEIVNSFFAGSLRQLDEQQEPPRCGIQGEGAPHIANSYWDIDITGVTESEFGAVGLNTEQMLLQESYEEWNFEEVWVMEEELSYPALRWQDEDMGLNIPGPSGLTGRPNNESIHLSWDVPRTQPQGYNIYRNGNRVNEELVEETQYQDTGLTNWETYSFFVRAVYEDIGESLPSASIILMPVVYSGGSGTEEDPFLIADAEDLNRIRYAPYQFFRQVEDIDLGVPPWNTNQGWQPIGDTGNKFKGTYDGAFYKIENLTINRDEELDQGLFGLTEDAVLQRIAVYNANVNAGRNTAGLLGNSINSDIIDSYIIGEISGTSFVGGIIGRMGHESTIERCYAAGTVTASSSSSYLGGLVGDQYISDIIDSYSMMEVNGSRMLIGGLVGRNFDGRIVRSYATGPVNAVMPQMHIGGLLGRYTEGAIINSYWDTETSGLDESAGGEGRTTGEMTYPYGREVYVDWDFENVWSDDTIGEINNGYPILYYQIEVLDTPQVSAELVTIEEMEQVRITWEEVPGAASYRVYSSPNPDAEDWGEPVAITEETEFHEPVERQRQFYRVVAAAH